MSIYSRNRKEGVKYHAMSTNQSFKKADELVIIAEAMLKLRQRYQKHQKNETMQLAIKCLNSSYTFAKLALDEEAKQCEIKT